MVRDNLSNWRKPGCKFGNCGEHLFKKPRKIFKYVKFSQMVDQCKVPMYQAYEKISSKTFALSSTDLRS